LIQRSQGMAATIAGITIGTMGEKVIFNLMWCYSSVIGVDNCHSPHLCGSPTISALIVGDETAPNFRIREGELFGAVRAVKHPGFVARR